MPTATPSPTDDTPMMVMDILQPCLLEKVLAFVDLPTRLRFATASTATRKMVYKQCSSLWRHIDLSSSLSPKVRNKLTDELLARLLKRVHAKHVTETLNLAFCNQVDGSGLSPLRHSPMLFSIDLRRDDEDDHPNHNKNDMKRAVKELRTMIHHKLAHVRFTNDYDDCDNHAVVTNFFLQLRAAKLQQAVQQGTLCGACGLALVPTKKARSGRSRSKAKTSSPPKPCQCVDCQQHFCLRQECPGGTTLVECARCAAVKCANCNGLNVTNDDDNKQSAPPDAAVAAMLGCHACARAYCHECRNMTSNNDSSSSSSLIQCDGCQTACCDECLSVCGLCKIAFCFHCINDAAAVAASSSHHSSSGCGNESDKDIATTTVLPCDSCHEAYCFQCRQVAMCNACQEFGCEECLEMKRCGYCGGHFCDKCRSAANANGVGEGGTMMTTMAVEHVTSRDDELAAVTTNGCSAGVGASVCSSTRSDGVEHSVDTVDICAMCQETMMALL